MDLRLTLATGRYDRTQPLLDGRIRPEGVTFQPSVLPPWELFKRQLDESPFDVAEFSMAHLAMLGALDDERFTAIPVFTSRALLTWVMPMMATSNSLASSMNGVRTDQTSAFFDQHGNKALVIGRPGEAYNVGVEKPEISMAELADKVVALGKELFGYKGKVVKQVDEDYIADNPERRCPIIEKARKELGYSPSILVDEGLRRSLVWYSGNREAEEA